MESLRTKAAKAADLAVKFKNQATGEIPQVNDTPKRTGAAFGKTTNMNETAISQSGGAEESKKVKELEKKVVKLRQENSALST